MRPEPTPYDTPKPTATVERERAYTSTDRRHDRGDLMRRYLLPGTLALLTFIAGCAVGWNAGRNDLLEDHFIQEQLR